MEQRMNAMKQIYDIFYDLIFKLFKNKSIYVCLSSWGSG